VKLPPEYATMESTLAYQVDQKERAKPVKA
jgi:hypothetical protein